MLTSWSLAVWGTVVSWDWQTLAPVITALATIVYTGGTLFLWVTTRRSVRAMENVVKLTFLQMLYETEKPIELPKNLVRDPTGLQSFGAQRHYQRQRYAALKQAFPKLYASVNAKEQATAPEESQDGR